VEIYEKLGAKYVVSCAGRAMRRSLILRARSSISMQPCSACAGDYADPDRTAREEFEDLLAGDDEWEWQGDEEESDGVDGFDVGLGE
jgi:hypothetical protein